MRSTVYNIRDNSGTLAKDHVSRFRHLMCQALMQIVRDGSYGCTHACASHKPISALSPVAHGDMCFPVRQPRRRRIPRVVYLGKGEYRRDIDARKFSYSRPAYISTLWRRRVAETAPQRRTRYTRAILSDLFRATQRTLFRMFDLEIYGIPGSRA